MIAISGRSISVLPVVSCDGAQWPSSHQRQQRHEKYIDPNVILALVDLPGAAITQITPMVAAVPEKITKEHWMGHSWVEVVDGLFNSAFA